MIQSIKFVPVDQDMNSRIHLTSVFNLDMIVSLIVIVNPVKSVNSLDPVCTTVTADNWQDSLLEGLFFSLF